MTAQTGILEAPLPARFYLEYRLQDGASPSQLVSALQALRTVIPGVRTVVALGPTSVRSLGLDVDLHGFAEIRGPKHAAPATQRDLWVWIQGEHHDSVFDQVLATQRALRGVADVELELRGFDYRSSRDLIGFEDGTANPKEEKAVAAALIPDGQPGAGGSFVLTQQWIHDLPRFEALPVVEQEAIVGRTKADSIELEGDAMPADSHVSRTDVKVEGTAMKILRRSSPYGSATEHGLYFVAFGCELRRFQIQLDRMYGVSDDGLCDRLTDFSRAVTGSYWFAPSIEHLDRLASA